MKKILFLSILLVGCGDSSNVTSVKNSIFKLIDPTITVGNALDTRVMCSSVKWSDLKDDRNRTIVRYECKLKGYDSYYESFLNASMKEISSNINAIDQKEIDVNKINEELENKVKETNNYYNALVAIGGDELQRYVNIFKVNNNLKPTDDWKYNFIINNRLSEYRESANVDDYNELIRLQEKITRVFGEYGISSEEFNKYQQWPHNGGFPEGLVSFADKSLSELNDINKNYINRVNETIQNNKNIITRSRENIKAAENNISKKSSIIKEQDIVQTIDFSLDGDIPIVIGCNFTFLNNNDVIFNSNKPQCLNMAYESVFNESYREMFYYEYKWILGH